LHMRMPTPIANSLLRTDTQHRGIHQPVHTSRDDLVHGSSQIRRARDEVVRAEAPYEVLVLDARTSDDSQTKVLCELDRIPADSARSACHENGLSGGELD